MCRECAREIRRVADDRLRAAATRPVRIRDADLGLTHRIVSVGGDAANIIGIGPIPKLAGRWIAVTEAGLLLDLDVRTGESLELARLGDPTEGLFGDAAYPSEHADRRGLLDQYLTHGTKPNSGYPHIRLVSDLATELPIMVQPYADGRLVAVCNRWGQRGAVLSTDSGTRLMELDRGGDDPDQTEFPLAWLTRDGRPLLIHGSDWNRLDVTDPVSGVSLTDRLSPVYVEGAGYPDHHLEYFHGRLSVSPGQHRIADDGWVWHPFGAPAVWSVDAWLEGNVWESEEGASYRTLCDRDYWDTPACWLSETEIAIWGLGDGDAWMQPGVRVFNAESGAEVRSFPGPVGRFEFDRYLIAYSTVFGTNVWDVQTGERLLDDPDLRPLGYHPLDKQFLSRSGSEFRLSWLQGNS